MKILVTGSKGFIARNLIRRLKHEGNEVVGYDIKDSEYVDTIDFLTEFDFDGIDLIYHLGAISSTTEQDILKINHYNTWFSIELFKAAIMKEIPVVYASSGSVYGNTMDDGEYLINPLNYYAASKAMIDMWVTQNMHQLKFAVGLRFFNVYGNDEQKDDMSTSPIYRFAEQAKETGVIKIFKGSQYTHRDFVSVSDVVSSMLWARDKANPGIYDVGTGAPISFMDVAEMIADKYNATVKFVEMPAILHGKYQFYSKARPHVPLMYNTVEEWLKLN
jgi:ADP-L-glycero-D-manno-heptose 6-epimerase